MRRRDIGGTVARVAIGVIVAIALVIWQERSRSSTDAAASSSAARAGSSHDPGLAAHVGVASDEPAAALAPLRDEILHPDRGEESGTASDASADEELARLRTQVAELEAEVARLRAQLADGSARRHALHGLIAANELRHGKLYEELVAMLVDDPESVAEDPRRTFDLILRLVDETGLAAAKSMEGSREIQPEPEAPETSLSLRHDVNEWDERDGDDGPTFHVSQDQVTFRSYLRLPKVPEGWIGQPLAVDCELQVGVSTQGEASLSLECHPDANDRGGKPIRWSLNVDRGGASLTRHPFRGDEDSKQVPPADLTKERSWLDRVFQQLMTRAR